LPRAACSLWDREAHPAEDCKSPGKGVASSGRVYHGLFWQWCSWDVSCPSLVAGANYAAISAKRDEYTANTTVKQPAT
jgi:hypothetical protein